MQIIVLLAPTTVNIGHVEHTKENHVPLSESQSSLRVLFAASLAATASELVERLVEAVVGAARVHRHRLEAPLDRHVVVLEEELELAGEAELVLSTEIV